MRGSRLSKFALFLGALTVLTSSVSRTAQAGPFDLDDDADKTKSADEPAAPTPAAAPIVTVHMRTYTLEECLALTDRNHPNLWAARARLAYVHAQLDEAHWTPWDQWSASSNFSVIPAIDGTAVYTSTPVTAKNITSLSGLQPFLTF